ncbi:hypothetical protein RIF29_22466 [Crotalaria pallida]|uniref:Uncharacterized protein n=1 Tax=Crotalaria pallida TaxID=3830 RepID=A0AAN9F8W4_CROPI
MKQFLRKTVVYPVLFCGNENSPLDQLKVDWLERFSLVFNGSDFVSVLLHKESKNDFLRNAGVLDKSVKRQRSCDEMICWLLK